MNAKEEAVRTNPCCFFFSFVGIYIIIREYRSAVLCFAAGMWIDLEENMQEEKDLIQRMNEKLPIMTKGQKKLTSYITLNYEQAAFMTAAKMGKTVGVSESTVVRFASVLEYSGYPAFQEAMSQLVKNKLNTVPKIEIASSKMTKTQVLESILQSDSAKIRITLDSIDKEAFEQAVEILLHGRKIYVVGLRSCEPLASFLCFYLRQIEDNVVQVSSNSASEMIEQMLYLEQSDVVFGISFPRYSMRTLKALEFANSRNAQVITLTDGPHSPLILYSSCNLYAKSEMASIVDSLVAPLSVLNALVVSMVIKEKDKVMRHLEQLEQNWQDYQVYEADEIDKIDEAVKMKVDGYHIE